MLPRSPSAAAFAAIGVFLAGVLVCGLAGCGTPLIQAHTVDDVTAAIAPNPKKYPVFLSLLPHRPHAPEACYIAVVDVDGLLLDSDATGLGSWGENPVAIFRERLDAIQNNHRVRGVVLRIHSPGGSVTASDIMWRDLQAFKARTGLPVVACLMDVAAGGGYYLATGADCIVAHPTTVTGAIGCILNVYNLQDLMAQFNIIGIPIKAGKNVDLGSPVKAIDAERRKLLQNMADEFHARFRNIVLSRLPRVNPCWPRRLTAASSPRHRRSGWGWSIRSAISTTPCRWRRTWRTSTTRKWCSITARGTRRSQPTL